MRLRAGEALAGGTPALPGKSGFTLIEILVVIAIISLLASLTFPILVKAKAGARETSCLSQLHQLGLAMMMYYSDYGELAPHLSTLHPTYCSDASVYVCPSDSQEGRIDGDSYGYMEGDMYLPSGVSYTYVPNWKYAPQLGWWKRSPQYGEGKWQDATPLAVCHWHWAKKWVKTLDTPGWGESPKGRLLILAVGGTVYHARAEVPLSEFHPPGY